MDDSPSRTERARGAWLAGLACGALASACAPAPPDEVLGDGAPCTWNVECASGLCIPGYHDGAPTGWPDGICTTPCGDDACTEGSECVRLDAVAYCLPACAAAVPCREGYVCSLDPGVCVPDCRLGWACGDALSCDAADGICKLPACPGAAFGEPCGADRDCASGICVRARDDEGASTGWVGGLCSAPCRDGACDAGGACVRLDDLLLCVVGCGSDAKACAEGYVCNPTAAACLPDCRLGWACGDGFSCGAEGGVCALDIATAAPLGAPCERDYHCASGVCAAPYEEAALTGWSDGMCIAPCGSASCGEDAACTVFDGASWCLPACVPGAPDGCRDGYGCHPGSEVCLPDCRLGWDCGAGYVCDVDTGRCELPALAPVGDPCAAGIDCQTGLCAPEQDADGFIGWTGGMCLGACGSDLCGVDTTCAVLDGSAWCLPSCAAPCRTGYVCDADYGACLPDCRLGWSCLVGFVCNADSGVCETPTGGGLWDPCDSDDDCDSALCVLQDDPSSAWSSSFCSVACGAGCPDGFECTTLGAEALCLPRCSGQQDCVGGYVCEPMVDACVPSCESGWICPDGQQCNSSGRCRAAGPGGGGG